MRMNLKTRILLGYLVPLMLMLGVALAVYWSVQALQHISNSLDQSHRLTADVDRIHLALVTMGRSARGYVILKNDDSRKNYLSALSEFREQFKALAAEVKDSKQQENLRRLSEFSTQVIGENQRYLELVDAGDASKAVELFRTGTDVAMVRELDTMVRELEKREREIVDARHEEQGNAMARLMTVAVGATAAAILLAILLGVWIASRISQTLNEAVAGMSTSSTEIAATVEQHERTVTQQAAAVNETTSTVEELGVSARQSASQAESSAAAAKQALSLTQEGIASANRAAESMAGMISESAQQVMLNGKQQATALGQVSEAMQSLSAGSKQMAAGTEQTKIGVQKLNQVALSLKAMI